MQIQTTNYGDLNGRVKRRLPKDLRDDTRVLLARKGNTVAGVAAIEHQNTPYRALHVHFDAKSPTVQDLLAEEVREETRHLKRRVIFE